MEERSRWRGKEGVKVTKKNRGRWATSKVEVGAGFRTQRERSALPERNRWERELRFDEHLNIYWATFSIFITLLYAHSS